MTSYKLLFIILLCFVGLLLHGQAGKPLFLCIGQSNMAGRAYLEAQDSLELPYVLLLNDQGEFETAKAPLNRYSTVGKKQSMQRLGPAYTFAQTISEAYYLDTILLVHNARGGTAIEQWQKGADEAYYEQALARVQQALKAHPNAQIRAIIWHQGESNSKNPKPYLKRLNQMLSDFRKDLNQPNLPFIAGNLGQWKTDNLAIRKEIAKIPARIPNAYLVSTMGLTDFDNSHFDARSQRILGRRYAIKFIEIDTKEKQLIEKQ